MTLLEREEISLVSYCGGNGEVNIQLTSPDGFVQLTEMQALEVADAINKRYKELYKI